MKDDVLVDCKGKGVDYIEAQVNGRLSVVLTQPNVDVLKQFLPCECDPYGAGIGSGSVLLAIQVNMFDCGGLAIGLCISHKMADASSLATFVNGWAETARGYNGKTGPHFQFTSLFPKKNLSGFVSPAKFYREKVVTKRFMFDASTIASLRAKTTKVSRVENPTCVEVVSAFIWKRFMDVSQAKEKPIRVYARHAVNLRGRMVPPLPEHSFGNMYGMTATIAPRSMVENQRGSEDDLVGQLRDAIRKIDDDYVKKLQCDDDGYLNSLKMEFVRISKGEMLVLNFSSWCRFPLYEADFGWGKPARVATTTLPFKNVVIFMNTKSGDGIEAWVNMLEEDMAEFERGLEFVEFVSTTTKTKVIN